MVGQYSTNTQRRRRQRGGGIGDGAGKLRVHRLASRVACKHAAVKERARRALIKHKLTVIASICLMPDSLGSERSRCYLDPA